MIGVSGEEEAEIVLPGVQQEGLTFDATGNLWIADDRAGLLVFRGAREKIGAEMKAVTTTRFDGRDASEQSLVETHGGRGCAVDGAFFARRFASGDAADPDRPLRRRSPPMP